MNVVQIVEYLRQKMVLTAQSKGQLCHPEVIKVSQQLDRYLSQAQRTVWPA